MSINNYLNYSYDLKIDFEKLEKPVLKIQKKIYAAAKAHAISDIYEFQNTFFSQKELVLLIIKKVVFLISKTYNLKTLYCKKLIFSIYFAILRKWEFECFVLHFVKNAIVEYSIILLTKPEWEARYEEFLHAEKNKDYVQRLSQFTVISFKDINAFRDFCSTKIITKRNHKNINHLNAIQRIIQSDYLSHKLVNFCSAKYNTLSQSSSSTSFAKLSLDKANLGDLFIQILYVGLEWHVYVNSKSKLIYASIYLINNINQLYWVSPIKTIGSITKYVSNFLSKANIDLQSINCNVYQYVLSFVYLNGIDLVNECAKFILKPSHDSIGFVLYEVRRKLYHKNSYGCWRINNDTDSAKAIISISKILSQWYRYYWKILSETDILLVQSIINKIFYNWQRKK